MYTIDIAMRGSVYKHWRHLLPFSSDNIFNEILHLNVIKIKCDMKITTLTFLYNHYVNFITVVTCLMLSYAYCMYDLKV